MGECTIDTSLSYQTFNRVTTDRRSQDDCVHYNDKIRIAIKQKLSLANAMNTCKTGIYTYYSNCTTKLHRTHYNQFFLVLIIFFTPVH